MSKTENFKKSCTRLLTFFSSQWVFSSSLLPLPISEGSDWLIYFALRSLYSNCSKIEDITHFHAGKSWKVVILSISEIIGVGCLCEQWCRRSCRFFAIDKNYFQAGTLSELVFLYFSVSFRDHTSYLFGSQLPFFCGLIIFSFTDYLLDF